MKPFLYLLLLTWFLDAGAAQVITAADWARPRSGDALVAEPALAASVDALLATPDSILLIRHPGGDEGALWASELEAWLVALGIASDRIERVPGSRSGDQLELEVRP